VQCLVFFHVAFLSTWMPHVMVIIKAQMGFLNFFCREVPNFIGWSLQIDIE
jgi:hypothetical protein